MDLTFVQWLSFVSGIGLFFASAFAMSRWHSGRWMVLPTMIAGLFQILFYTLVGFHLTPESFHLFSSSLRLVKEFTLIFNLIIIFVCKSRGEQWIGFLLSKH